MPDQNLKLTELLFGFKDLPGEFYRLQKNHLFSESGIKINISPWLFYTYEHGRFFGGIPSAADHYWMIKEHYKKDRISLYFPDGVVQRFKDLFISYVGKDELNRAKWKSNDTSQRLNSYLTWRHICLVEDESVEFSFELGNKPLTGTWNNKTWHKQSSFELSPKNKVSQAALLETPLFLVIKIKEPKNMRQELELQRNFYETIQEAWEVVSSINRRTKFDELSAVAKEFKLPGPPLVPHALDLFSLKGLILRFHAIFNYEKLVRGYRINLLSRIRQLDESNYLRLVPVKRDHMIDNSSI